MSVQLKDGRLAGAGLVQLQSDGLEQLRPGEVADRAQQVTHYGNCSSKSSSSLTMDSLVVCTVLVTRPATWLRTLHTPGRCSYQTVSLLPRTEGPRDTQTGLRMSHHCWRSSGSIQTTSCRKRWQSSTLSEPQTWVVVYVSPQSPHHPMTGLCSRRLWSGGSNCLRCGIRILHYVLRSVWISAPAQLDLTFFSQANFISTTSTELVYSAVSPSTASSIWCQVWRS